MIRGGKFLITIACAATAYGFTAYGPQIPPSVSKEELQEQIRRNQEEIRITTELLEKTQKDRSASESQLKMIRTQLGNRRKMLSSLEKQMAMIGDDISKKNKDVSRLTSQVRTLQKDYAAMVYAAYKNYKLNNFVLFLFASDDFNTATRRMDFMKRYNRLRQQKAADVRQLSDSLRREVSQLDEARTELDATRRTHNAELTSLGKDESQYKKSVSQLSAEQTKLRKTVQEKQAQIDKAQKQLQEIIAAEVRRARQANVSDADQLLLTELSGRFDQNRGLLPFPLKGGVVIDRFGEHAHQFVQNTRVKNPGINIAGTAGAAVNCVFDGKVAEIVSIPTYNRCIIVRHGSYLTVYANLVSVSVKKGDAVSTGQMLGRIDNSRDTDSNFLHFEIHRETENLDPEEWLRRM